MTNRISASILDVLARCDDVTLAAMAQELQQLRLPKMASLRVTELTVDLDRAVARAELAEEELAQSVVSWRHEAEGLEARIKASEGKRKVLEKELAETQARWEGLSQALDDRHAKIRALEGTLAQRLNEIRDLQAACERHQTQHERDLHRIKDLEDLSFRLGFKKLLTKDEHMELERIVRQSRVAPAKMLQVIDRIRVEE